MAVGLAAIHWQAPWLAPYRALGQPIAQRVDAGVAQTEALNAAQGAPVRFVPQSELPDDLAYEKYIFDSGSVPTREGLHDFFNAICWMHFPQTKVRLNQLQAQQIAALGIAPVRGPARDGITVFDENAAFLSAPDALWNALVAKDWQTVFVRQRALWQQAHLVLFGHALLEKLVSPRKAITAHVYRVFAANDSVASMDTAVAGSLTVEVLASKPFAHLPVLGVPQWWAANESPDFYADTSVFRPPRAGN